MLITVWLFCGQYLCAQLCSLCTREANREANQNKDHHHALSPSLVRPRSTPSSSSKSQHLEHHPIFDFFCISMTWSTFRLWPALSNAKSSSSDDKNDPFNWRIHPWRGSTRTSVDLPNQFSQRNSPNSYGFASLSKKDTDHGHTCVEACQERLRTEDKKKFDNHPCLEKWRLEGRRGHKDRCDHVVYVFTFSKNFTNSSVFAGENQCEWIFVAR